MNETFYSEIRSILAEARNKAYHTANFAMVEAYWSIGKSIIDEQGGNEKAAYGDGLIKELSKRMTQDFGKGFTETNLKYMRQFYLAFPIGHALRSQLVFLFWHIGILKSGYEKAVVTFIHAAGELDSEDHLKTTGNCGFETQA